MQRAVTGQDRQAAVLEGRGGDAADVAVVAVDVLLVLEDRADLVDGRDDGRVVEGDLVRDPLVVDVDARVTQDEVLGPVGGDPAGGVAGLDAGAPGLLAGGRDRVRQRDELVERGRDLVAGRGEGLRGVPDVGLDVGAHRGGVERAVDRAVPLPGLGPVLVHVGLDALGGLDDLARLDEALEQARLRDERDVGGVAALHLDVELGLELAGPLVVDGDAGALGELLEGLHVAVGFDVADGGVHRDRGARGALVVGVRLAAGRQAGVRVGDVGRARVAGAAGGDREGEAEKAGGGAGPASEDCHVAYLRWDGTFSRESRAPGGM